MRAFLAAVIYGTVESVRPVRLPDGNRGDSIFAGAILGTVGGGIAGNEVHRSTIIYDGQEIVVRLDDGRTITVMQPGMPQFEPGERVRVLSGPKGSRVEAA